MFKSNANPVFRSQFSETIFYNKYAHSGEFRGATTWDDLAYTVAHDVCGGLMHPDEIDTVYELIRDMKLIPGGRYLYYAGRPHKFFNNCFLFRSEEDTREDWADLSWKFECSLMTGGGAGNDYSVYRPKGSKISRTGGFASGPLPKMEMINEIGRRVMQGGSRRSALYASLSRAHQDVHEFLRAKDWHSVKVAGTGLTVWDLKQQDFNFAGPLDMTNISVNYGTDWLELTDQNEWIGSYSDEVFMTNVRQALRTGEPGFSFNFFDKERETLRNACTEITSEDDSDVCNLASLNLGRIQSKTEFALAVALGTKFLICGTIKAELPFDKVYKVREKNRRLGLGLMGVHEWLLTRGFAYGMNDELASWLEVYRDGSDLYAARFSQELGVSEPVAKRAIAPTGSIGILAGTTTGIEPLFATAYKRRYLKDGDQWHYQYVVDGTAQELIEVYSLDPEKIETSLDLAKDPERRLKFQYDVQQYVDQGISSTINLPEWGSEFNNEDTVVSFAKTLAKYAPGIRGFTCYPDGARGGQPLVPVPYEEAVSQLGQEFLEAVQTHDVCDITGKGGSCGV